MFCHLCALTFPQLFLSEAHMILLFFFFFFFFSGHFNTIKVLQRSMPHARRIEGQGSTRFLTQLRI